MKQLHVITVPLSLLLTTVMTLGTAGAQAPKFHAAVLAAVSYTNIVLADVTNNVATSVPDASRTFFDLQ